LQDQNEYLTYLVETYGDMVYRLALTRVRNPHDAQDIVQQVFLKLVKNIDRLESEEHVKAWLIKVTSNEGKSLFSSAWRRHTASLEESSDVDELSVEPPELYETNDLMKAVFRLPEKYRIVIHLFYYQDLSTEEISKVLGRTNHTVRSQLSRGRDRMRKELKEVFEDV
jgi:RNA polymerase sigma-70 factor (ECF subfamily)